MTTNPENNSARVPEPPRWVPRWFFLRRMRAMVLCGALFLALGASLGIGLPTLFYVLGGYVSPLVDLDLDRSHASATGVILGKELDRYTHINGKNPWCIRFQFSTSEGQFVDATGYSYDQAFAKREVGSSIDVEYDPNEPSRARSAGGSAAKMPLWAYLMVLGLTAPEFAIGVTLLILVTMQVRAERVLLEHGVGTEAEVIQVKPVRYISFGTRHPFDIYYRFVDHCGIDVMDKDRTYHYAWAEKLKSADKVGVVYNPRTPAASVLWLHGAGERLET